jgi:Flp pilus assembly protein TadG
MRERTTDEPKAARAPGEHPSRRRGLALVEMALILPLLLLLTIGVIEYSWLFLASQKITNAARQGARVGVRADATSADVSAAVAALLNAAGIGEGQYSLVLSPSNASTVPAGETFTVAVSVPYANVQLTGAGFLPLPSALGATVSMAKEGP